MTSAIYNIARIYLRVSTAQQDLQRQEDIVQTAKAAGYYIAGFIGRQRQGRVRIVPSCYN